jgi:4-amino-4-deoxy-L-arabinose transferase-like glycosyltransferase
VTTVLEPDQRDLEAIPVEPPPARGTSPRSRARRWLRGPESDPVWARPALFGLLGLTAVLYVWGLGASGWANSYYSMAVQAASHSWKAMFFGSLDAANSVTVDKAPASLWVMDLSARLFGVNSWSILVPNALEGVATVAVLYMAVKRWFGPAAGLLAGAIVACTPVAALMFRFNNPDALLVLLLTVGAYALTRALEKGNTLWLVAAFACVGTGFLAKMLQALLVIPAFGLVYLFFGPPKLGRRIGQLAIAAGAFLVSALWWVVAVMLVPASSRPYIGGSQNNSLWNLIFGYNGFGRLNGNESGSVGGGAAGTNGRWGPTGWLRMFNSQFGGEASWLIPAAVIFLVAGLVFTWRMKRTDRTRAALCLWGGWLVVTAGAFSLGQGIIHEYYTIALVPAIGALIGIGATRLWNGRAHWAARGVLALAFAATCYWSYQLLNRVPAWHPGLRTLIVFGGIVGTIAIAVSGSKIMRRGALAVAIGALFIGLLGPAAYTLATVGRPHDGAIPTSGPAAAAQLGRGGPGGGPRAFGGGGQFPGRGQFQFPGGGQAPSFGNGNGTNNAPPFGGGNGGGMGGLLNGSTSSSEMTALLKANASDYTWVAATTGANNAAGYQLATGDPVMAIGGFNGTDPSPTLAQFQSYVAQHKIHYYISGGGNGFGPGQSSSTSSIEQWVTSNFSPQTVGGVTVYDLTTAAG